MCGLSLESKARDENSPTEPIESTVSILHVEADSTFAKENAIMRGSTAITKINAETTILFNTIHLKYTNREASPLIMLYGILFYKIKLDL